MHAVTYDDRGYTFDTTGADAIMYPDTEFQSLWTDTECNYGRLQEEHWHNVYASQDEGTSPWTQSVSATPVQSTVSGLRSSPYSGYTSACAIYARMTTVSQHKKLNNMFSVQGTHDTVTRPDYMMFNTSAAVHVCPL